MLNILFFIKDHQDLDHFSPIIINLKNKYKIFIKLENSRLQNDKRFKILSNHTAVFFVKKNSKIIYKLKTLLLNFFFITQLLNFLQKKKKINKFFKKIFRKNFLLKNNINVVFYDHRPAHDCPYIIKAKLCGIKVISIPHGYNIFTEKIDFLENQNNRNIFDNYLVQTQFQKKILSQLGINKKRLIAQGSPRFNKEWVERLDVIYKKKNFFMNTKPTISIFLGHWKYYIDKHKTLKFLDKIVNLKKYNIFLNLHTRGTSALDEEFIKKIKSYKDLIINYGEIYSSITIKQSNVIVGVGTSILLEAISRNKTLICLSFLQNIKTVFDHLDSDYLALSEPDGLEKIQRYSKEKKEVNYKDFYSLYIKDDPKIIINLIDTIKNGNLS